MRIFEPHIHMYSRVTDDYDRMSVAGIERVVEPAFWLGEPRTNLGSYVDYFSGILNFETTRAAQFGIEHWVTLSMNPREAGDRGLAKAVVEHIEKIVDHPRVVGIGEVGFDRITEAEEECLVAQLELARRKKLPVIVHTPHKEKLRGAERVLAILKNLHYDENMVCIDHNTEETIGAVKRTGCWAGHTIYPVTKLSPERAADIIRQYGRERMLLNSSADWGPSDPLMVPRTCLEMRRRGFSEGDVRQVVWDNPNRFFAASGRLNIPGGG
ncbi:MAG: TatD family hydrolase [Planctomycetes bacterium]|nr:TatD family hydrolase [Planctomycetota bacterium]